MTRACVRCGLRREVNESRNTDGMCRDCQVVEADLATQSCGTETGYYRHRYQRTIPCEPCLAAHREQDLIRRRRRGIEPRRQAACGTYAGYQRHTKTAKEPACEACLVANAAYERDRRAARARQDDEEAA